MNQLFWLLHAIHTACGIETRKDRQKTVIIADCMQFIPLAVLKRSDADFSEGECGHCMQLKSSRGFGENRKKRRSFRKPAFEFAVSKDSGKQYCMQFIPLAVLKLINLMLIFDISTTSAATAARSPSRAGSATMSQR